MNPVGKQKRRCPKCSGPMSSNSLDLLCFLCETTIEDNKNRLVGNLLISLVFFVFLVRIWVLYG